MNTGLLNQLDTYFSDLDSEQGPVTAAEVSGLLENVRELPPTPVPVRSRPKTWVAIVAAAVTIIVVASIPLLFRSGTDEGPPATDPVTSTTNVTSTTTIEPDQTVATTVGLPVVVHAPTVEWRAVSFDGETGPLSTNPGGPGDGQFIVYDSSLEWDDPCSSREGCVADLDGDLRTVLWRSPDGLDWERFHLSEFDGVYTSFVGEAFGTYVVSVASPSFSDSYVATSTDLITWTKWFDPGSETPREWAGGITATDSAAIISNYGPWVRVDSSFANPVIIEPSAFGLEEFGGFGKRIVATATSFYVDDPAGGDSIWSSPDGIEWTEHILSGAPTNLTSGPLMLLANHEQVLAYTMDEPRYAWIGGEDGFTLLENFPSLVDRSHVVGAATQDGFIMGIGSFPGPDYTTADGSQWTRIDGALSRTQDQAVGPTILMPIGSYQYTTDPDRQGGSAEFVADGGWKVGTTRP